MTPLERLGLEVEVAARSLLGGRGHAALLQALISADGRVVAKSALWEARSKNCSYGVDGDSGLKVRMSRLRAALIEVGLPDVILTARHGRRYPSDGYSLPEPGRTAVIARLIEEAETC